MADSPKPTAAMLHGESGVLRSLIKPLAGFASRQKKSKVARSSRSRNAASSREITGSAALTVTRKPHKNASAPAHRPRLACTTMLPAAEQRIYELQMVFACGQRG